VKRDDAVALELRRRALGSADPQCSVVACTETDPRALTGSFPNIICAEHLALEQGRRPQEQHHVAGRRNRSTTVWLLANWHAVLTFMQQTRWDRDLLRNPRTDPLIRAAASIRGAAEVAQVLADGVIRPTEEELLALDRYLVEVLGVDWPAAFEQWQRQRSDAP
jgi:hypothetical protein